MRGHREKDEGNGVRAIVEEDKPTFRASVASVETRPGDDAAGSWSDSERVSMVGGTRTVVEQILRGIYNTTRRRRRFLGGEKVQRSHKGPLMPKRNLRSADRRLRPKSYPKLPRTNTHNYAQLLDQ